MPSAPLLAYYCVFILLASIVGGMIPVWIRLTHRWMEFSVSFVAGVMLGIAMLHMLPHALVTAVAASDPADLGQIVLRTVEWLLAGTLVMFFIERFFCYHHHDVPSEDESAATCDHPHHDHDHKHDLNWGGAALGMTLHSVLAGVALAASVAHGSHMQSWALAGFGTFLVIFLHKPFDAMTIGMLMARGQYSLLSRNLVNGLFALAVPLGVVLFYLGIMSSEEAADATSRSLFVAYALAFSAGAFLCISLSDLLPELQFHQHDRLKLSAALLLGLAVAYAASHLEAAVHGSHAVVPPSVESSENGEP